LFKCVLFQVRDLFNIGDVLSLMAAAENSVFCVVKIDKVGHNLSTYQRSNSLMEEPVFLFAINKE
jgi:hypothetical protein